MPSHLRSAEDDEEFHLARPRVDQDRATSLGVERHCNVVEAAQCADDVLMTRLPGHEHGSVTD